MAAASEAAGLARPAVVSVGSELILGERRDNENLRWMCSVLSERDIPARVALTVGDDPEVIAEHVGHLYRAGYGPILVSGGMGGTHDDRTREGIAAAVGVPLRTHAECFEILRAAYGRMGLEFTEERRRMAELPAGAALIPNPAGAPGFTLGGRIYAFPGFPRMLRPMLLSALDIIAPAVAPDKRWLVEEQLLPVNEGRIARHVEALSSALRAAGSSASIGIYPSNELFGAQVKLVLRCQAADADAQDGFGALVRELQRDLAASRL
mmetsp:Transcript_104697/g.333024  ORF Transcript_104697/g.333024 Transcript_104697/m.333024 type:complete len:266 (+) Transcript_104697:71-868(+)